MKKFMRLVMAAGILLVAVLLAVAVLPAKAAETNVIYISDKGTGDGSSPSKPLRPETRVVNNNNTSYITNSDPSDDYKYYSSVKLYENSVLYQAAEKLAQTGGTIVLVGDVVIDYSKTYAAERTHQRDFYMPEHGNAHITVTSNGNGRLVVTEGAYINLGGKMTFENMDIVTKTGRNSGEKTDSDLCICCGLYETVFGEGLKCYNETYGSSAEAKYYLSISGTERYGDCTGDTSITVKSGTWNNIYGSMYGNAGNIHRGDTFINISGGTVKGYIVGGARDNSVFHYGDITVNVSGGNITGSIYVVNSAGVGYKSNKADINISGGSFTSAVIVRKNTGTLVDGGFIPYTTVNLSSYPATSFTKTVYADKVIYPSKMASSVLLAKDSSNGICYVGEDYIAEGMSVNVTYTNGQSVEIEYSPDDPNFVMNCKNSKEGQAQVTGTYGGKPIAGLNKSVNVVNTPVPTVLGAQINTKDQNGGLRFVAEMMRSAEEYIEIKDYGFYIWNSASLSEEDSKNFEKVYGIEKLTDFGNKFRAENDKFGMYNNSEKLTFSGVYDGIKINEYGTEFIAAAYIEYEYNGRLYTRYSAPVRRSVIGVANKAVKNDLEDVDWIKTNVIDRYAVYLSDRLNNTVSNYDNALSESLRDSVVEKMLENAEYVWTPSASVDLREKVTANGIQYYGSYNYTAGTSYYGIPYIVNAKAELGEFKSYVKTYKDGKNVYLGPIEGVEDFYSTSSSIYAEVQSKKYKLDERYYEISSFFPAADSTSMIINIWNTVTSNNVNLTDVESFIPSTGKGTVAVGGYNPEISFRTDDIVSNAGQNTMYESYASCKRGDVLVCYTAEGAEKLYMVMADAASGQQSMELMTFGPTLVNVVKNGITVGKTHFVSETKTFAALYSEGFIPVTLPELAGGIQYGNEAYVVGFDGLQSIENGVVTGKIVSTGKLLSVTVKLSRFDDNGEFFDETYYCNHRMGINTYSFALSYFDMSSYIPYLVEGKEYTLSVFADIAGVGEKKLLDYKYTKPVVDVKTTYASYYDSFDVDFSNITQTPIDHMKEQMDIFWTPASTFKYANLSGDTGFVPDTTFKAGVVYKGVLYADMRATLDDFKAALDTTPVFNEAINGNVYTLNGVSGSVDWNFVMGNHCSSAMYHAYQRVTRLHASSRGNANMRLLGLDDLYYGVSSYTDSVRRLYGYEALYESYALAQKGDFMYRTAGGGHTRMVQDVIVVRDNVTGRIDPKKSMILMIEQTDTLESEVYGNGSHISEWTPDLGYDSTWWEHYYTFETLASGNASCIILRPTEFETGEVERHYVGLTRKATKKNLESTASKAMGVVESNYPIIGVYVTVELEDGTKYTATQRGLTSINSYNITSLFTSNATTYAASPEKYIYRPDFVNEKYTYTLEVELAVGRVVLDTLTVN